LLRRLPIQKSFAAFVFVAVAAFMELFLHGYIHQGA
jgi:hypothetical protein